MLECVEGVNTFLCSPQERRQNHATPLELRPELEGFPHPNPDPNSRPIPLILPLTLTQTPTLNLTLTSIRRSPDRDIYMEVGLDHVASRCVPSPPPTDVLPPAPDTSAGRVPERRCTLGMGWEEPSWLLCSLRNLCQPMHARFDCSFAGRPVPTALPGDTVE